ncbi:uncharacterized protein BDCG_01795 [Blastomyces dermatitidis ER-3]|uniref:Uncharacterized protein n=3 Tax=Blastomyces TaxID=229219 RepID=A0A179UM70_BLAGS|nr:uncharacterized protein BDBG_04722 [Blastomyces gilchristii SLH14081]XP_045274179.1 uncharacterized protein BDCG_01795 [Blastomyces dermatitidis ER-3]EGE84204.2 hypothetical protein BDDG_07149 [Blastomyces dermatitidis ATCC 18188]EQL30817.1 hypothetical protein BDFG_06700 [Blastomyces dermatitidis ATCC 26199]EEQ86675.2 hypothetical protein BDCG_01795 [Blastomyces dermatitidis ER-3]OAT09175.1 hypothetical protein BDBG_04722 [Blastomyces gilchristii SLH14081]
MSNRIARTRKIKETETGSVDSRGGSGTMDTEKMIVLTWENKMASKVQHSGDQQQVDSTSSTRPLRHSFGNRQLISRSRNLYRIWRSHTLHQIQVGSTL